MGCFSYVSTSATVQTVVKAVTIVIVNIFRGSQLLEEVGGLVWSSSMAGRKQEDVLVMSKWSNEQCCKTI